jgi:hypothetical protein
MKIKWIEILTILQAINFALWMAQAYLHFMNIWVQFVLMVYVGLLGGEWQVQRVLGLCKEQLYDTRQ